MKVEFIYRFVWFIKTTRVPWERVLRNKKKNKRWPLLPERGVQHVPTTRRMRLMVKRPSTKGLPSLLE